MSPLERGTVRRKLAALLENLDLLRRVEHLDRAEWMSDADRRDASKRRLAAVESYLTRP
jgi:hypothetical protein